MHKVIDAQRGELVIEDWEEESLEIPEDGVPGWCPGCGTGLRGRDAMEGGSEARFCSTCGAGLVPLAS
jgi:hypothetical protein